MLGAKRNPAALIASQTPQGLDRVFLTNGGADANEHAIRLARLHTGRIKVLSTYRSLDGANTRQRLLPHAGVDFGGPLGSPVIAAADGVVSVGEEVARGRIIGRMGMSGNALGVSHVHFEICTSACRSHADGDLAGTGRWER